MCTQRSGAAALSMRSGTDARFGARIAGRCVCLGGYGVGGAAGVQAVLQRQRLYSCACSADALILIPDLLSQFRLVFRGVLAPWLSGRGPRARARAFFRGVFYTPSVNVTRTLHVRNNARNNFATTSSLRSCGPELSGERFFACALRALFGRVLVACALALRSPAISGGSVVPGGLVLHLAWPSHCSSWSTSSGGQVPPHTSKKMDYIRDCTSQDELHS